MEFFGMDEKIIECLSECTLMNLNRYIIINAALKQEGRMLHKAFLFLLMTWHTELFCFAINKVRKEFTLYFLTIIYSKISSSCEWKKKSARPYKNNTKKVQIKKTQKGKKKCVIDCLTYLFHLYIQGKEGSDSATSIFTIFGKIG